MNVFLFTSSASFFVQPVLCQIRLTHMLRVRNHFFFTNANEDSVCRQKRNAIWWLIEMSALQ